VNFDEQAASYDSQWAKLSPVSACLHFLIGTVLSDLPDDARILCVGAGTGAEMIYLAQQFPGWRLTAVEPSAPMLEVCRSRADSSAPSPNGIDRKGIWQVPILLST
jgi:tRNA (cmo5U34)-methyltransferase